MNRFLDGLGMPPVPVIAATLIGWGIVAYAVFGRTIPFVLHTIHHVTAAL